MPTCPYCETDTPNEYNFCINCTQQIKCMNCGRELVPNKPLCLFCGTHLVSRELPTGEMNEYSLEEKHTSKSSSRSIKLRFTDSAIDKASAFLGGQVTGPVHVQRIMPQPSPFQQHPKALPVAQHDEVPEQYSEPALEQPTEVSHYDEINVYSIFEKDGDDIIAVVTDFKGKTKKEQQERFALLYVSKYLDIFNKPVPSEKLISAAIKRREGLYDANFSTYLNQIIKQFVIKSEMGLRINAQGRKEVEVITAEIKDDDLRGFAYWESKPTRKRSSMSKEDEKQVKEWVAMGVDIGIIDVRELGNATNHALFAVWLITRELKVVQAVKPGMAYAYLTQKYSTVSVSMKAFSNAFNQNKTKFARNSSNLYYLTPEAEREVDAWIHGEPIHVTTLEVDDTEGEGEE